MEQLYKYLCSLITILGLVCIMQATCMQRADSPGVTKPKKPLDILVKIIKTNTIEYFDLHEKLKVYFTENQIDEVFWYIQNITLSDDWVNKLSQFIQKMYNPAL